LSRILLDTQALLFATISPTSLSDRARQVFADGNTEKLLSYASVWEMSIKLGIGKLKLPEPLGTWLRRLVDNRSLTLVEIGLEHLLAIETLPAHHGDPFDRLIAATCLAEDFALLSNDSAFDTYGVRRVW